MAVQIDLPAALADGRRKDLERWGISNQDGIRAIDLILATTKEPQVVVSPAALPTLFARAATGAKTAEDTGSAGAGTSTAAANGGASAANGGEATAGSPVPVAVTGAAGMERVICEVWQDLLGGDVVTADDNFFDLGGDSLIAIQVTSALNERLPGRLTVAGLFEHQTVRAVARALAGDDDPEPAGRDEGPAAATRRERAEQHRRQQRLRARSRK